MDISISTESWETHLAVDALCFHGARQAYLRAVDAETSIREAEDHWKSLQEEEIIILDRYHGQWYEAMSELEPVHIQMEGAHYQIGKAHAPLLKEVAVVHMLCSAALEAHINTRAKDSLQKKENEVFERLALDAKWLFLPKLLGLRGFETGHQPFQRFSKLVKYRNALIHYKGIKEEWRYGSAPGFLTRLGLRISDAGQSIKAVEGMISELSDQCGVEPPYWLNANGDQLSEVNYFELIVKQIA